ncbi:hypothetical protein [Flavobacterium succinicans]|uniref:Lipocalin-like domain-containing protein n=1 Tax=Flavobacterium succinicans TaxID=29536 RepID=A0A199XRQ0_9FLAO|nr:hypothetical protein [Flavobacterium succinicans]OAZ04097.1 hypothetical protein FLB_17890 [Flavobacterium succinicans]
MKTYFKLLLVTFALTLFTTSVEAQGNRDKNKNWGSSNSIGKWEKIGTQTVQKTGEKDDFRPSNRKSYSALKVMVRKNTVNFNKMTIYFENGQKQDVELRNIIKDGGESRVINLSFKRRIDKIRFEYRTRNLIGSRAEVDVWARS